MHLSGAKLGGLKFRRQAALPPFICDFLCPELRLIVELDGETHDPEADARRDTELAGRGFTVLRFTNLEVRENIEGVLETILRAARGLPGRFAR